MSWPHILSFSRVLAGPVVAALVLAGSPDTDLAAAIVFAVAAFTDLIDGRLARYSQRVSPLGVFIDTTSDKVMVSLSLIGMSIAGLVPAWVTLAIIGREFLISGLRSYAASCNRIISAHIWGKGKAALTMFAIVCLLMAQDGRAGGGLSRIGPHGFWTATFSVSAWLMGISAVLTIVSGARYIVDAWPLFRPRPQVEVHGNERRAAAGGERR